MFRFDGGIKKVRKGGKGGIGGIGEKIEEIVITEFRVDMNGGCVIENEGGEMRETEGKMGKEGRGGVEWIGIGLRWKDGKEIVVCYKGEV
ncbi:hypothetical protein [Bacillus thuringiensis]|uniref:hypothetical protein n=1 Tax=Bacillus thuringiensis TaxID=1428 RepID=UPI00119E5BEA|nr:hypothetical protein [Bacillus thuringiensis]